MSTKSMSQTDYEPDYDLNQKERNYPSIKNYYEASCTQPDKPVTYQPGLSNFSNLNLGDDRIMFKESLMDATFTRETREQTLKQTRHRAKSKQVLVREYVDAVRAIGFEEVERMERIIRDKLQQRSVATSSPFQVPHPYTLFHNFSDFYVHMPMSYLVVVLGHGCSTNPCLAPPPHHCHPPPSP